MTTTIVTAFVTNINSILYRSIENYIELGRELLNTNTPKIVFMEKSVIEKLGDVNTTNTLVVPINKTDNYLYAYESEIDNSLMRGDPSKDTLEYMFTMCHKTEWVRQAIELNPFGTDQFIWMDFSLVHVMKPEVFPVLVEKAAISTYDKVRIARINLIANGAGIMTQICWFFAGGVFGGASEALLRFADLAKAKCLSVIKTNGTLPWEVNIWYLVYRDNPEIFDMYYGNHDVTILQNY